MNIMSLLFSFQGRVRRLHLWLYMIAIAVISSVIAAVTIGPAVGAAAASGDPNALMAAYTSGGALLYWVWVLAMIWPNLAMEVKRCHDRNRTGWFILIVLIPIIGGIWLLIELFALDGTPGPNRFGPSPKGLGGPEPLPGVVT